MTKTATVSLHGNTYEVDPMLVGMKVELIFDPFDLTEIGVRTAGKSAGKAVPPPALHRAGGRSAVTSRECRPPRRATQPGPRHQPHRERGAPGRAW
ncbi:Mu transposase C-terminal domain-containing protein [Streptomyces sp. NPDC054952]